MLNYRTKTSSIAIVRKITKCIEKLHPDAATQKKLFHKSHPKGRLIRLLATSSCWNLNKVKVYYRLWKDHPVQKYISAFLHLIRPHISIIFFFHLWKVPIKKRIFKIGTLDTFEIKTQEKVKQFFRWRYFLFLERKKQIFIEHHNLMP